MTLDAWYWLVLFLWIIFGAWRERISPNPNWPVWAGWAFVQLILFVLIGLRSFGSPVK